MNIHFTSGKELLDCCRAHGPIWNVMLLRECEHSGRSREAVWAEMAENLEIMKRSVERGLAGGLRSMGGLVGDSARKAGEYAASDPLCGKTMFRAVAASMAVVELNACMGRIVAAPTAGASGILPGTLVTLAKERGWPEEKIVDGLFTAGAVGFLIARNATVAGADGGCQAETGSAAAMAAAALVELQGGTPEQALHASAIALKNIMGLVCDPVAGLVESPCVKRNALGAANALVSADLALAGVKSIIPFDEVVDAMRRVGGKLPTELRETALGGIAATPTAKEIAARLERGEG